MTVREVPSTSLRKGDRIALPFNKVATVIEVPKVGIKFVNLVTTFGKTRIEKNGTTLIEVGP